MKIIFLLFSLLLTNIIYAQDNGSSALQFLRISSSPRASALGNSYTSIIGDSESMFYNPGALAFFKLTTPHAIQFLSNPQFPIKNLTGAFIKEHVFINGLCELVFWYELSCIFLHV